MNCQHVLSVNCLQSRDTHLLMFSRRSTVPLTESFVWHSVVGPKTSSLETASMAHS